MSQTTAKTTAKTFDGLKACFSPDVPQSIRVLWVFNGGSLTHTPLDFYLADFFFCNGLEDSWLPELTKRDLMVLHADWVLRCVQEDFLMPRAKYVLDDLCKPTTSYQQDNISPPTKKARAIQTSYSDDEESDCSQMLHDQTTLVNPAILASSGSSSFDSVSGASSSSRSSSSSITDLDLPASRHLSVISFSSDTSVCYDSEEAVIRAKEEHASDTDSLFDESQRLNSESGIWRNLDTTAGTLTFSLADVLKARHTVYAHRSVHLFKNDKVYEGRKFTGWSAWKPSQSGSAWD